MERFLERADVGGEVVWVGPGRGVGQRMFSFGMFWAEAWNWCQVYEVTPRRGVRNAPTITDGANPASQE